MTKREGNFTPEEEMGEIGGQKAKEMLIGEMRQEVRSIRVMADKKIEELDLDDPRVVELLKNLPSLSISGEEQGRTYLPALTFLVSKGEYGVNIIPDKRATTLGVYPKGKETIDAQAVCDENGKLKYLYTRLYEEREIAGAKFSEIYLQSDPSTEASAMRMYEELGFKKESGENE